MIALSWSGGKDSALALWRLREAGNHVVDLISTVVEDFERVSIHGVRVGLLREQARALDCRLHEVWIPADCSIELYERRLLSALATEPLAKLDILAFGDLFLARVRAYREQLLQDVGCRASFPLWGADTSLLAREFIGAGFEATIVCVDSSMADRSLAGRRFDSDLLARLPSEVDPCGENGEFHTFVSDGPIFGDGLACETTEIVERGRWLYAELQAAYAARIASD